MEKRKNILEKYKLIASTKQNAVVTRNNYFIHQLQ